MREILFRAKRKDNGNWVYGDLIHNIDCVKIREREADINRIAKSYVVIPETVGQYTGLKDKNGNEIYEGDILRLKCWDRKTTDPERETLPFTEPRYKYQNSVIEYWQSCTNIGYRLRNGKGKTIMVKPSALSSMEAEVIGTIFDKED